VRVDLDQEGNWHKNKAGSKTPALIIHRSVIRVSERTGRARGCELEGFPSLDPPRGATSYQFTRLKALRKSARTAAALVSVTGKFSQAQSTQAYPGPRTGPGGSFPSPQNCWAGVGVGSNHDSRCNPELDQMHFSGPQDAPGSGSAIRTAAGGLCGRILCEIVYDQGKSVTVIIERWPSRQFD